jgi:hypothetical protein
MMRVGNILNYVVSTVVKYGWNMCSPFSLQPCTWHLVRLIITEFSCVKGLRAIGSWRKTQCHVERSFLPCIYHWGILNSVSNGCTFCEALDFLFQVTPIGLKYYGRYTCKATNRHGTSEHVIVLKEAKRPSDILQAKLEVITGKY